MKYRLDITFEQWNYLIDLMESDVTTYARLIADDDSSETTLASFRNKYKLSRAIQDALLFAKETL